MTGPLTMPQRVNRLAPIGSLLKSSTAMKPSKYDRAKGERDPRHLTCIRQLPCLKCGLEPCCEAAHVRMNSASFGKRNSMGKTPDDRWGVPLCRGCHQDDPDAQHRVGERVFWDALGINPMLIARDLYALSPDILKMRAVVVTAIVGRQ